MPRTHVPNYLVRTTSVPFFWMIGGCLWSCWRRSLRAHAVPTQCQRRAAKTEQPCFEGDYVTVPSSACQVREEGRSPQRTYGTGKRSFQVTYEARCV